MNYPSLPARLLETFDRLPNPRAMIHKVNDRWEDIPSHEVLRRIAGLAQALAACGIRAGDRVALFSPNRPEWHIADFAITGLGAVMVPIYFREAPERIVYILEDAAARAIVVAGEEQLRKLMAVRDRVPRIERIIVAGLSGSAFERLVAPSAPAGAAEVLDYEPRVAAAGPAEIEEYRRRVAGIAPDQLATMIYTSGTTGEPKGVMLTHTNLVSNALESFRDLEYGPGDLGLCFLPLAHVYERTVDYGYLFAGIPIAYLERMEQVQAALLDVRPTVMAAVPRFFEKFYANILATGHKATGWKRALFDWAIRVAHASIPWRAYGRDVPLRRKLEWWLANRLVYSKFRAGLGGRIRSFSAGGAPLSRELAEFFWAVDVRIYQGYGLTETSPVVSTNTPTANKVGSVGRPIANVEVRIADDGEVLVRGPCVMQGYHAKPEATREALSPDGWLSTGDIGYLDADGFLVITDRKKDLLKTAAGKFIAPQPVENRLKTSSYILNAVVVGDRRRFVTALVVPNFANVEGKAREAGIEFSSPAEMVNHPWVRNLIQGEIGRLTQDLAQYEQIKRFALLDHDFTFDDGQLTYTLKLKRRAVEQRYAAIIEELYADSEEAPTLPS